MKIKSLLLGSAAAMVVASGAQAADAIVVEPEPVEYVRICDAYGSGFFYIPGTETCIAFSGFVRSSYEKVHIKDLEINYCWSYGTFNYQLYSRCHYCHVTRASRSGVSGLV